MKTQKTKSLKLVKASVAQLDNGKLGKVQGGGSKNDCNQRSLYMTSCHAH